MKHIVQRSWTHFVCSLFLVSCLAKAQIPPTGVPWLTTQLQGMVSRRLWICSKGQKIISKSNNFYSWHLSMATKICQERHRWNIITDSFLYSLRNIWTQPLYLKILYIIVCWMEDLTTVYQRIQKRVQFVSDCISVLTLPKMYCLN